VRRSEQGVYEDGGDDSASPRALLCGRGLTRRMAQCMKAANPCHLSCRRVSFKAKVGVTFYFLFFLNGKNGWGTRYIVADKMLEYKQTQRGKGVKEFCQKKGGKGITQGP
jgi:hypothetical protein